MVPVVDMTATDLILGWDFSNYDADLLTAGKAEQLVVRGTEMIQGYQNEAIGDQLIDRWRGVDGNCNAVYAFLYWSLYGFASRPAMMRRRQFAGLRSLHTTAHWQSAQNPATRRQAIDSEVTKAILGAQHNGISWVFIDCEHYNQEPPGISVGMRQAEYLAARKQILDAGLYPARYSTVSFWQNEMGGLDIDDPWWVANYGAASGVQPPPAPIRQASNKPGAPPQKLVAHQFSSLPAVAGRDRDYDYFYPSAMPWYQEAELEDDLVLATYATNSELRDLKAGVISRATAISNARSRIADVLASDDPHAINDTLLSHLAAPHDGTGTAHTHEFSGNTGPAQAE